MPGICNSSLLTWMRNCMAPLPAVRRHTSYRVRNRPAVLLQFLDVLRLILLRDFLAVLLFGNLDLDALGGIVLDLHGLAILGGVISFTPLTFLTLMVRMRAAADVQLPAVDDDLPAEAVTRHDDARARHARSLFFRPFFLSKIDLALRAAAGLSPSARRCRASVAAFSVASSEDFSSFPKTVVARLETSRLPLAAAFSSAAMAAFPLAASFPHAASRVSNSAASSCSISCSTDSPAAAGVLHLSRPPRRSPCGRGNRFARHDQPGEQSQRTYSNDQKPFAQ